MGFLKKISKKGFIGILILLALISTWVLFRSCSKEGMGRKKVYFIGRDSSWYPNQLLGKERNLQAFMNDLFAAIGQEMHLHLEWLETNPIALIEGLDMGSYDVILSSLQPTFATQHKYLFSNLIFELGPVLVVPQKSSAKSLEDMKGKTVGVWKGSIFTFNTIKKSGAHFYDIFIVPYDNINKALEALERNQMDGLIMDAIPAYSHSEGYYYNKLKVISAPLNDEGLRLIGLKNSHTAEFLEEFNNALLEVQKNGIYTQLIAKWKLVDPEVQYLNKQNIPK